MKWSVYFLSVILIKFSFVSQSVPTWIVGGKETTIYKVPYIVSVQSYEEKRHFCGGSIIGYRWILTAAHCVKPNEEYYVRVGSSQHSKGGAIFNVIQVIVHPNFERSTAFSDIALLELEQLIPKSSTSKIIYLPEYGQVFRDGALVRVSGWGLKSENGEGSDLIRTVKVTIYDKRACNEIYGGKILNGMFCAEAPGTKKGACQMDSGGPLVYKESKLIGIVSWGYGCSDSYHPGVYTEVSYFRYWIKEITGI